MRSEHSASRTAHALMGCAAALLLTCAARAEELVEFKIPPQSLETALLAFADQTGAQVATSSESIAALQTKGVSGRLTPRLALARLIEGSDLVLHSESERSFSISARSEASPQDTKRASDPVSDARPASIEPPPTSDARKKSGESEQPPTARARANRDITEEIIVTAQKRAESVLDIPISIAVINNQDIERRGVIGMEDYLRSVPGVSQIDRGSQDNAIVIRGITTSPQFENFSSGATVATYFDETPITAAGGLGAGGIDVRPVDIERIEVLRGPQGTTYGSASLGGAVRIIPVRPKLDGFSAKLAASYSDTSDAGSDNSMVQGVVNIPLVEDKFGLRGVGYRYEDSGFYRNVAGVNPGAIAIADRFGFGDAVRGYVQDDVGRMRSTGGRLSALWQATDRLDVSLNFLKQTIEQDGAPVATVEKYEQIRWPVDARARIRADEPGEIADTDIDLLNAVVNYDFGWATLTTAVSAVDSGSEYVTALVPTLPLSGTFRSDFKSRTAETRLASQLGGRVQFLVGLFHENIEEDYLQVSGWLGAPTTNQFVTDPVGITSQTRDLKQSALFGEVSYDLTEKLAVTVGGRVFEYDRDDTNQSEGGIFSTPLGAGVRVFLPISESDSSFKANVRYKPTEESLVYASWAEGFRLGRPTPGVPSGRCDTDGNGIIDGTSIPIESTRTVDSDFLESYEVGGKFTLFERRMVIETAAYHTKWKGLPIRTSAPTCGSFYTANVGAATSDGVELQASVFVAEGLKLEFGGGYTDAQLSEDAPGLTVPAFEGDRLPASPKVSANLAAQYDFDVAGYDAFIRADSFYSGKFYGDLAATPNTQAGDYVKVDARAGMAIKNLSVELFVRNLTNEDAFTWRGLSNANSFFGHRLRPRTIGVQLGYSFE